MTELKGVYIRVKRHKSGLVTYGGNQGFFSDMSVDPEEYDWFIHTHFLGTILGNLLYIK